MPPPARISERRGRAFAGAASDGTCSSSAISQVRARSEEDQDDADQFETEEDEHPPRRRAVEREAEQTRSDAGSHRREEEPVVAADAVDATPLGERERPEAEFDRAQEAVLAENIRRGP